MKKNIVFGMLVSLLAIPTYTQAQEVATENGSTSAEAVEAVEIEATDSVAAAKAAAKAAKKAAKKEAAMSGVHYSAGSVVSVGFGAGCSGMMVTGDNVKSSMSYPSYNVSLRYTYYFFKFMGFTTGVEYSTYRANLALTGILDYATQSDIRYNHMARVNFNDDAFVRSEWKEVEELAMVEVPIALSFKAKPNKVGFLGTLGLKLGVPVKATYKYNGTIKPYREYTNLDWRDNKYYVLQNDSYEAAAIKYNNSVLSKINGQVFAEAGILFQVHPRIDMSLSIYGSYCFTSVNGTATSELKALGFGMPTNSLNQADAQGFKMNTYNGMIGTSVVDKINPFNCGVKLALHINCREKSDEQIAAEAYIAPEVVYVYDTINKISVQMVHDTIVKEVRIPCDPVEDEEVKEYIYYKVGDSSHPIFEPADMLDKLAEKLKADPEARIILAGHSSPEGNPIYNEILAQKRADTIARMLLEKGVKKDQLIVRSYGSEQPSNLTGKEALVKDRRVEVIPNAQ